MSKRVRSSEVCADCSGPGESHRPGPLPSALLAGTPAPGPPPRAGRVRAVELCSRRPGSRRGGAWAAVGRDPSRACQSGRAGGRRPPVPPVPLFFLVPSVPGRAGRRRGRGCFPTRKGLG